MTISGPISISVPEEFRRAFAQTARDEAIAIIRTAASELVAAEHYPAERPTDPNLWFEADFWRDPAEARANVKNLLDSYNQALWLADELLDYDNIPCSPEDFERKLREYTAARKAEGSL